MLVLAKTSEGRYVRVPPGRPDFEPETYRACYDGVHRACPVATMQVPPSGRCDCACHMMIPPV